jgi:acyl-coenzyme A thioesterase PaaI-like protein
VEPRVPAESGWLHHRSCWGCGPDNPDGLHLSPSLGDDGAFHAEFTAEEDQHGPVGRVHGGLLAVPMDCLSSWAAIHAMRERARSAGGDPDGVVALTGGYEVQLFAPTPTGVALRLRAAVTALEGRRARVHVEVRHEDAVTAAFEGLFVEVPIEVAGPVGP